MKPAAKVILFFHTTKKKEIFFYFFSIFPNICGGKGGRRRPTSFASAASAGLASAASAGLASAASAVRAAKRRGQAAEGGAAEIRNDLYSQSSNKLSYLYSQSSDKLSYLYSQSSDKLSYLHFQSSDKLSYLNHQSSDNSFSCRLGVVCISFVYRSTTNRSAFQADLKHISSTFQAHFKRI